MGRTIWRGRLDKAMVSFGQAIKRFYKGYFDFSGRSPRSEYWWAILFQLLVLFVYFIILAVLGGFFAADWFFELDDETVGILFLVPFVLVNLLPNIALAVRRFHDLNQTGWLVLVFNIAGNIPLIGLLVFAGQMIWYAMPGTVGTNKYGPDPLRGDQADIFT